jgi:hypothetical protein
MTCRVGSPAAAALARQFGEKKGLAETTHRQFQIDRPAWVAANTADGATSAPARANRPAAESSAGFWGAGSNPGKALSGAGEAGSPSSSGSYCVGCQKGVSASGRATISGEGGSVRSSAVFRLFFRLFLVLAPATRNRSTRPQPGQVRVPVGQGRRQIRAPASAPRPSRRLDSGTRWKASGCFFKTNSATFSIRASCALAVRSRVITARTRSRYSAWPGSGSQ